MTHSSRATDLVRLFEGCKLEAYQDQNGVWTIGYGHTAGVKEGDTCEQVQALRWLDEDLGVADKAIHQFVLTPLNQNQWDALTSFVFNIGAGNFEHSTALRQLNAGDLMSVPDAMKLWSLVGAEVNPGLVRRRQAEANLFMEPA